jgi:hypothetical protein
VNLGDEQPDLLFGETPQLFISSASASVLANVEHVRVGIREEGAELFGELLVQKKLHAC